MRALLTPAVGLPLVGIFTMQTALTLAAYAFPIVIPVAAADLGISPEAVGFFTGAIYLVGMMAGLMTGKLLARFGPTRVFQALLALAGAGACVMTLGAAWTAALAAVLVGLATGPMNPAGSFVLARAAPSDVRALVFSLKQCGTPMGGMLAGVVLPPLMAAYDWRLAMLAVVAWCGVMLLLAPLGRLGGAAGERADGGAGPLQALRIVLADPAARAVTATGFGLAVCQMGLATYVVVFLWRSVGYTPAEAGLMFAVLHLAGIGSRILLGFIADRALSARWALVMIGVALSVALTLIPNVTSAWSVAAVYAVMIVAGASGNGWVGLYFAELARLSPPDRVAEVAAGSQFVTYLGLVSGPVLVGALLGATDSYALCFLTLAGVALLCAAYLALAGGGKTSG